jgi:hypothetical protein
MNSSRRLKAPDGSGFALGIDRTVHDDSVGVGMASGVAIGAGFESLLKQGEHEPQHPLAEAATNGLSALDLACNIEM